MAMQTRTVAVAAVLWVSPIFACAIAQSPDALAAVELAAARAMLASPNVPKGRVAIESRFARDGHAPGAPAKELGERPASRSAALARALEGRVGPISTPLGRCAECVTVVLTLSNPIILRDTAAVSVTALYEMGRGMRGYETIRFTLVRRRGSWEVHESVQLGIT